MSQWNADQWSTDWTSTQWTLIHTEYTSKEYIYNILKWLLQCETIFFNDFIKNNKNNRGAKKSMTDY